METAWDWLLAPIDSTRPHAVDFLISWHARLMATSWVILAPAGVIAARFLKVLPGSDWPRRLDDRKWWVAHRLCQYGAALLSAAALLLIVMRLGEVGFVGIHRILGWASLGFLAVQVVSAWLRGDKGGPTSRSVGGSLRGDHFDMTNRRIVFERIHKSLGYATLLIAAAAVVAGLWTANAPRWMWIVIPGGWFVWFTLFVALQRRGMAIDTYQAIWGLDSSLPGAKLNPIGWGVRRLKEGEKL